MKQSLLRTLLGLLAATGVLSAQAQTDTVRAEHFEGLSLKDLLETKVVSVSKKSERLFEAPLSASVLRREDIDRAGCNSIMEAMRLIPGIIVRQQSNGNYDIHLRGMDNIPPRASFDIASTTTLVMIDSRPIYSYLRGGTFWETIPVDLNDVDRIEVVRGPAAALYGPNAVNGVINIITRKIKAEGIYLVTNMQQGSYQSQISNASVGYRGNKASVIVSGNYQGRQRTQESYFEFQRNRYFEAPDYLINFTGDTVRNLSQRFPETDRAMEKYAGNLFVNWQPAKKTTIDFSAGLQHSFVQKISAENEVTPLSTAASDTKYADLTAKLGQLSAQFSLIDGTQNVDFDPGNNYYFRTFDANIEYNLSGKNFSLRPGVSYHTSVYDDTQYSDTAKKAGIFNARGAINSKSVFLRGEYSLLQNKLRVTGGVTANQFNYPDSTYISYQFAATYKVGKTQLLRAVYSRAPRSSNIFDTYVDQSIARYPIGYRKYAAMQLTGDKNLKLLTAELFELGYRGSFKKNWHVDVEVFQVHAKNANLPITQGAVRQIIGVDTIEFTAIKSTNLPLRFVQNGVTVTLGYSSERIQIKPFVTFQRSVIRDYAASSNSPEAYGGVPFHYLSGIGSREVHKATPSVFGGASINFVPNEKMNININSYYYSKQTYSHLSSFLFNDGVRGIDHIKSKLIINFATNYEVVSGLHLQLSVKNILNQDAREFFYADKAPLMVFGGMKYEF